MSKEHLFCKTLIMDDSSSDRLSFGNIGFYNINSRPKFQPMRVKALLEFDESDDDEEVTSTKSDSEDQRLLPLENNLNEDAKNILEKCIINEPPDQPTRNAKFEHAALSESPNVKAQECSTLVTNQNEANFVNTDVCVSPVDIMCFNADGRQVHETKSSMNLHEINATNNYNPVLNLNSEPYYTHIADTKSIQNTNLDIKSNSLQWQDEITISEVKSSQSILIHSYSDNGEGKEQFHTASSSHRIAKDNHLNNEKQDVNKDLHKDHKSANTIAKCSISVLPSCGNSSEPSNSETRTSEMNNYETPQSINLLNERHVHSENLQTVEDIRLQGNSANYGVVDTPMKHPPCNSTVRPNPCLSHRNIFQTPQGKLQCDTSKNQIHTPATLLSHWIHNNQRQTPLQNNTVSGKEYAVTPRNMQVPVYGHNVTKHGTPRYADGKKNYVRQPLTDTCLSQSSSSSDSSAFLTEIKPRSVCTPLLAKVEEMVHEDNAKPSSETQDDNLDSQLNEELKEQRPSNVISESRKTGPKKNLNINFSIANPISHGSLQNNLGQKFEMADNGNGNSGVHNVHSLHAATKNDNIQGQGVKHVVENISSVQFSLPSTLAKQKENKTIFVKDKEYLILGVLGQGMSGEVLRVQDMSSLELRAVKCVNLSRMDKDSAQGCLEEISMLYKLQAPCIIRMFDYEVKYPMVYVVMEMGDTDLSQLLKSMLQEKQIPLTMILYYWTEMLTAVKHIHNNGVIHSDLKPANFLLVRGRLKLIDFGIASSLNADMTSVVKNCPIGTLNYISPEALMDTGGNMDSVDHKVKYKISYKSDVWSLGCILYSLVYGHTPFHHIRSQWAKVNAIINPKLNIHFPITKSATNSTQNVEETPPILIDVMQKCLQHDPKARPTVEELLHISYIPSKQVPVIAPLPNIPGGILVKIKQALSEEEWRQLTQILEKK